MSEPRDVEVRRDGVWVSGSMIGWRREEDSSGRVMVRVTEGAVEKTAWADPHDVRWAERRSSPPTESLPFLPKLPGEPSGPVSATANVVVRRSTGRHAAPADDGDDNSSWPSPGQPADEVEPTRSLPVPAPRLW